MLRFSLFALLGVYSLQVFSVLPSPLLMATGLAAIVLLSLATIRKPGYSGLRSGSLIAFVCGSTIMWLAATVALEDRLDAALVGKTLTIEARVIDFPVHKNNAIRLVVHPLQRPDLPSRIRLSWYPPAVNPSSYAGNRRPLLGEVWELQVRLKRPRGLSNPRGFDYEGWLFRQRIGATGYVHKQAKKLSTGVTPPGLRMVMRQQLAARIDKLFPPGESRAVLKAITVGARGEISDRQWQLYARTGTSHLMAISGLHIGLAASGSFILVWAILALFPGHRNLRDMALVAAIGVAFCYAELSGLAVPARRAFGMAILAAAAVLMRRRVSVSHVLGVVCLLILVSDPLSVYAPGFMLSFLAVVVLLWSARSNESPGGSGHRWRMSRIAAGVASLTRLQMLLLFGLMPVTIALFGRVAVLAPLTNMLVIPIFNLITVPASLLGLLFAGPLATPGDLLLKLAYASVESGLGIINWIGALPVKSIEPPLTGYRLLLVSGATIVWAVLPVGWPGRHVAIVAFVATLLYKAPAPAENCLDFHALDVGQGLAVVLRTRNHTLVYDTGPSFRGGSNLAKRVIEPFLKSIGVSRIDVLVVSHSDLDHSGGVDWLTAQFEIGRLLLGEKLKHNGTAGSLCRTGQRWRWNGVQFRILHPENPTKWQGNNGSCVLLVSAGSHKLLITGDIEAPAERSFEVGAVDLVVVPHHGSRTSSSPGFVDRLSPGLAVVSTGYRNRWGFPKPDVMARWESTGAELANTATNGAISRRFCAGNAAGPVRFERDQARRYWHDAE